MARAGVGAVRILDPSGDNVADDATGALKVKLIDSIDTIDIGDVSLLLGGNAADTNVGAASGNTLRVAIANSGVVNREDSAHNHADYGIMSLAVRNDTLESFAGADGDYAPLQVTEAGALYSKDVNSAAMLTALEKIDDIQDVIYADDADFDLNTDKGIVIMGYQGSQNISSGDVGAIKLNSVGHQLVSLGTEIVTTSSEAILGTSTYSETSTVASTIGVVRNDTLDALVGTNNEIAPLQVNATGALWVDGSGFTQPVSGTVTVNAGTNLNTSALSTHVKQDTMITHLSEIEGAVETIEGAVSGDEMQVDIVSAPTLTVNSHAVTNAGTFAVQISGATSSESATSPYQADKNAYIEGAIGIPAKVKRSDTLNTLDNVANHDWTSLQVDSKGALYTNHGMTAMVSEVNNDVGTGAEDLRAAGDIACKRVDMMASPDNTGYIWVGDSTVANDGTGGGIRLGPGDFYSVDVNSVNDIHVAATVNGEDIMYTYHT